MQFKASGLLALAAALASPAIVAGSPVELPHFYGRADISLNSTEFGDEDAVISTENNASRIGLHNTHELRDGLEVMYRLEFEVDFDERKRSNEEQLLRSRNSYVGLRGAWGEVFVGIHDTPVKKAELKVDQFSDAFLGDIDNLLVGQQRVSDTVNYRSPRLHGLQGWVMLIPGEGEKNSGGDALGAAEDDGIADAVSVSVDYKGKPLQAVLAYETEVKGLDILRASAQYAYGPFRLGALVQQAERSSGPSEDGLGFVLGGALQLTPRSAVKLQYAMAADDALTSVDRVDEAGESLGVSEGELISLGVDHQLAKSTKLYVYASDRTVDGAGNQDFTTLGLGLRHEFGKKK